MDAHRALASRGRESLEETNAGKGQDGNQRNEEKGKSSELYLGEFANLTIAMETESVASEESAMKRNNHRIGWNARRK